MTLYLSKNHKDYLKIKRKKNQNGSIIWSQWNIIIKLFITTQGILQSTRYTGWKLHVINETININHCNLVSVQQVKGEKNNPEKK